MQLCQHCELQIGLVCLLTFACAPRCSVRTKMAEHARQAELAALGAHASAKSASAADGHAAGAPAGQEAGGAASNAAKDDSAEPVQQPVAQLDATAGEQAAAAAALPGTVSLGAAGITIGVTPETLPIGFPGLHAAAAVLPCIKPLSVAGFSNERPCTCMFKQCNQH